MRPRTALCIVSAFFIITHHGLSADVVSIPPTKAIPMSERPSGEWQMERHDEQMTGKTDLKGTMRSAPQVQWSHYLGLWTNHLIVAAGNESGSMGMPEESFGEAYRHDNALAWGLRQETLDVDGRGGMMAPGGESSVKIAKLLLDVAGLQRVEFDNAFAIGAAENYGRLIAYDEGIDRPRVVWQTERVPDMYAPVVCLADTDLDGMNEIVMMTQYHLAVYDAATGAVRDDVRWNVGRNYGQLDVLDVDGDGLPDFVIQADAPPHLEFIRNSPNGASLAWSHKYLANEADVAVPTDFFLNTLPNTVRDLDGDGRIELAVNIRDFRGDKRWRVVVFDVITGDVKAEIVDRYLWAVTDLDGDGRCEFFVSEAYDATVDRKSPLHVAAFDGTSFLPRWSSAEPGRFCMRGYTFPRNVNSASTRGPVHHSTILTGDVDGDGAQEFFASVGKRLLAVGPGSDGYRVRFAVESPSEMAPRALAVRRAGDADQVLVEVSAESGDIVLSNASAELVSHFRAGSFRMTPTVADVDGDGRNEIIVEDAAGYIALLDPPSEPGEEPTMRWRVQGSAQPVWVTWKTPHAAVPAVDLDGDGAKEIICSDGGDEPHTTIMALRADGSVYWRTELDWLGPRLAETFRVGRFRPVGPDVLVTIQPTTQPEMLCLDGRTGAIRWHKKSWKDEKGQVWPYPNRAITFDADGDGFEEVYGSYAYMYYVLDGRTGEPLRKTVNIWHEVFHRWQSYFTPIPADYDGDGEAEFLLASESFAIGGVTIMSPTCEVKWEVPLDNSKGARGLQGIGDVDGDGLPEIGFGHLDGRFVCYDGKTGALRWEVGGVNGSGGHVTSGDIDSDGRDEFLYPLASRELIAFDDAAPGHVLWRVSLGGNPDTPLIADVDDDGMAEIVVFTDDGFLNVLK
ncbi:hypothetical protein FJZ36_09180 [Candidatus Poribacteria bacterium]|nr:hypothetical protein [Candidatus Poribacteria bacterium]